MSTWAPPDPWLPDRPAPRDGLDAALWHLDRAYRTRPGLWADLSARDWATLAAGARRLLRRLAGAVGR